MSLGIVALGASTAGLAALEMVLSGITDGFPASICVVLHRGPDSKADLAETLQPFSMAPVREPEDKESLEPGTVYIAPADYHMLVETDSISLSVDERVNGCRPSVDLLFGSAADAFGRRAVGVVLTGSGVDGAEGTAQIRRRGGLTIAQDPLTAEAPEMPRAAIATGGADRILPLGAIGPALVKMMSAMLLSADGDREGRRSDATG